MSFDFNQWFDRVAFDFFDVFGDVKDVCLEDEAFVGEDADAFDGECFGFDVDDLELLFDVESLGDGH